MDGKDTLKHLQTLEIDSGNVTRVTARNLSYKGPATWLRKKAPAVKPDDLSSIFSTHKVEGQN